MKRLIPKITVTLILISFQFFLCAEVVEKIYAVVNGELITFSELKSAEVDMTRVLAQQFKGEELNKEIKKMKKELLDRLIEQKVILSYAREKNYDVDGDVQLIIKNIKEQNNLNTDEELQKAIASQGIDYQQWKRQIKESRIQMRYIYDMIGSKIKIDNASIMEYYKENIDKYTIPAKFTLNCIFLDKNNYTDKEKLDAKKNAIDARLKQSNFLETAKKHSELPGAENNYLLGEFKKGELNAKLEEAAAKLKPDEHSGWIETETGWYIIQLVKFVEPQLTEYKKVRTDIENTLRDKEQDARLTEYIKQLKKQSHIKIYEKSNG
jgi:peptidyl-prolyl cis-trans isomerase SurA